MSVQKIALLGTGLMGAPMARNLCQAGVDTTVWNRTANKAKHLAHFGATVAQSAAGAVAQADIVISMLSDGPTGVMVQSDPDVRASLKAGAIWVEMGSIKPEEARASAANLAQLNVGYVDAPVSGGTKGAEEANLAIMAGGDLVIFEDVCSVFDATGACGSGGSRAIGEIGQPSHCWYHHCCGSRSDVDAAKRWCGSGCGAGWP